MHKEEVFSTIVYVLMILVAAFIGFFVISPSLKGVVEVWKISITLFIILFLVVAVIFNVIAFEVAHIIGAKIGGYKVEKVNFLGFEIRRNKDTNKVNVKLFRSYDGLTGETAIVPIKEDANPRPYTYAPLVVFFLEVVCLILAYIFIKTGKDYKDFYGIKYIQLLIVTIGGMLFIYNYFPAKLDSTTDGYRMSLINKKINVEAFNTLLKLKSEDYDKSQVKVFEEITDFTGLVNLEIAEFTSKRDHKKALEIIDNLLKNREKISSETWYRVCILKIEILLLDKNIEEAKTLYIDLGSKGEEYLKTNYSLLTIKSALLYFGLIEKSESVCNQQISKIKNAVDELSKEKTDREIAEIQKIIDFINKENPEIKLIY